MIPLILLPGLLNDAELWAYQQDSLRDIAAAQVPDLAKNDTITVLAQLVLSRAPRQFALAGLSMGGYVAMEIMRQAPERIIKLALLDTSARPDTPEQTARRQMLIGMARSGRFKGVTPRLLPMLIHPDRLEDEKVTAPILDMAQRVGREGFQNQQTAIMNRIDSRPHLPKITCPAMIIVGAEDQLTPPPIAAEIAGLIPNARMNVVERCGHLPPLEQPEATAKLLRQWLENG